MTARAAKAAVLGQTAQIWADSDEESCQRHTIMLTNF